MSEASRAEVEEGPAAEMGQAVAARLLSTAAGMFWRQGYAATSTRQLSWELGLQKASLYYHMEKKEDLLYAICVNSLNHISTEARSEVAKCTTIYGRIEAMIRSHVGAILKDRDKHATMLTELRSLSPARREAIVALRDEYEEFVRGLIKQGQDAGLLRGDLSAKLLTLSLLNLLNWSILWFRDDGPLSAEELGAAFQRLFLDGARAREGSSTERSVDSGDETV